MKFCAILICFVIVITCVNGEDTEKIKQASRKCIKSTEVDVELVKRVKNGDIVDDPKVKVFISCVLQKLGLQKSDGSFATDTIRANLPSGLSAAEKQNIMEKCITSQSDDAANEAWRAYKCYRESSRLNLSQNL